MDVFQKVVCGVVDLPLLRNAHKNKNKQKQKQKRRYLPTSCSGYLPDIRRLGA
jgi:hypothetical protein